MLGVFPRAAYYSIFFLALKRRLLFALSHPLVLVGFVLMLHYGFL
jgi:hypothetical protein